MSSGSGVREPLPGGGSRNGSDRKPSSVRIQRIRMVISLGWPSPAISSNLPAAPVTGWSVWATPRRLFGLAPTGGCRAAAVTSRAVGSYPTISPLPLGPESLWGRCFFCCPVRRLAAPRRYLAVCPMELGLSSTGVLPAATIASDPWGKDNGVAALGRTAGRPHGMVRSDVRGHPAVVPSRARPARAAATTGANVGLAPSQRVSTWR